MKTKQQHRVRKMAFAPLLAQPRQLCLHWTMLAIMLLPACSVPAAATPAPLAAVATATVSLLPTVTPDPATSTVTATLVTAQPVTATATLTNALPLWITHTVVAGDTLSALALRYDTSAATLQAVNGLTTELILVGQQLRIPVAASATPAVTVVTSGESATGAAANDQLVATPAPALSTVQPSPLEGAVAAAYPATLASAQFTLHYTPGTRSAEHAQQLADQVAAALAHHERLLGVAWVGQFDVYAASTLFAAPDQALRGRSFSSQRRFFFLDDGAGTATDQQYIIAHELTHVFTWNSFGAPASVMLHEGIGVYAGMAMIAGREFLPLDQFCSAYLQAGALPRVSNNLRFMGHIRDLENYYSAGCFVEFLIERAGPEKFGNVYTSGNYAAVYGKTLRELEDEWIATLAATDGTFTFAPADLVRAVNAVKRAYDELFSDFRYTPAQMAHYYTIDAIRIALLAGRIETVKQYFNW